MNSITDVKLHRSIMGHKLFVVAGGTYILDFPEFKPRRQALLGSSHTSLSATERSERYLNGANIFTQSMCALLHACVKSWTTVRISA